MNRLYRRILFFIATVVFLSLSPLVVLYAVGYRLGNTPADPVPVGVIAIESFPRRATVIVDGKEVGRTPHAITNLPPGTTRVTVQQTGFTSWSKNIPVAAALVTEIRGVRLFPENLTPQLLQFDIQRFSLAPNRQLLARIDSARALSFTDIDGEGIVQAVPLRKNPTSLLWSPGSSALVLGNNDGTYALATISGGQAIVRTLPALTGADIVVWDQRIVSRLLLRTPQGELQFYNTLNGATTTVATDVATFGVSNRDLYVAFADGSYARYNLQGDREEELPWEAAGKVQGVVVTPAGAVALWGDAGTVLLSVDGGLPQEIATNVQRVAWSPDGRMLLLQTDQSALYVYNVSDERSYVPEGELQLVTRQSRPITSAEWFAGGQHLLLQVADELIVTEIDTRDHAVHTQLATTNLGEALATVGENGTVLYFLQRIDGHTNLMQLPLVVQEE